MGFMLWKTVCSIDLMPSCHPRPSKTAGTPRVWTTICLMTMQYLSPFSTWSENSWYIAIRRQVSVMSHYSLQSGVPFICIFSCLCSNTDSCDFCLGTIRHCTLLLDCWALWYHWTQVCLMTSNPTWYTWGRVCVCACASPNSSAWWSSDCGTSEIFVMIQEWHSRNLCVFGM